MEIANRDVTISQLHTTVCQQSSLCWYNYYCNLF